MNSSWFLENYFIHKDKKLFNNNKRHRLELGDIVEVQCSYRAPRFGPQQLHGNLQTPVHITFLWPLQTLNTHDAHTYMQAKQSQIKQLLKKTTNLHPWITGGHKHKEV